MAKVLVIDDLPDNVKLLQFNLEDDGHEVVTASSGEAGINKVYFEHPDLILLDIMMPGIDGIEVIRTLKSDADVADTPIIMVTAKDLDDTVVTALDLGAHDYITKPFHYAVLSARVRSALRLKESQEKLAHANAILQRLASLDPLTEVYNRRYFYEQAAIEISRAHRHHRPMTVMMLDADHFKALNDEHGHLMGDEALRQMAAVIRGQCRRIDIIGRLGGEEFAVCCPDTDLCGAELLAERIRREIAARPVVLDGKKAWLTVSIGLAGLHSTDDDLLPLMDRADQQLYAAKAAGRNQIQRAANAH